MMRAGPAPSAWAARTNSRSRSERVAPRTSRATVVQPTSVMMTAMRQKPSIGECAHCSGTPSLVTSTRRQHDQQRQPGQGDDAIGQPHQQRVRAAADIAGRQPDQRADDGGGDGDDEADAERDAAALEQAQQQVAAELVRAQPMRGRRRLQACEQIRRIAVDAESHSDKRRRQHQQRPGPARTAALATASGWDSSRWRSVALQARGRPQGGRRPARQDAFERRRAGWSSVG